MPDSTIDAPVTLCVLLWAIPEQEAALGAYEDQVLALVPEHGGRVLQRGTVDSAGSGDGKGEAPTEVQFLEFESESFVDSYMKDPRRTSLTAERDAAIARTDVHRIRSR
jgi:uncharacterized protein (DUF1330 family)